MSFETSLPIRNMHAQFDRLMRMFSEYNWNLDGNQAGWFLRICPQISGGRAVHVSKARLQPWKMEIFLEGVIEGLQVSRLNCTNKNTTDIIEGERGRLDAKYYMDETEPEENT